MKNIKSALLLFGCLIMLSLAAKTEAPDKNNLKFHLSAYSFQDSIPISQAQKEALEIKRQLEEKRKRESLIISNEKEPYNINDFRRINVRRSAAHTPGLNANQLQYKRTARANYVYRVNPLGSSKTLKVVSNSSGTPSVK